MTNCITSDLISQYKSYPIAERGKHVIKSNLLANAMIEIVDNSIYTLRIINTFISLINRNDTKFSEMYKIRISDILPENQEKVYSYKFIDKLTSNILDSRFRIIDFKKDGTIDELFKINFFDGIKYHDGCLYASFSKLAGPHLLQLGDKYTDYLLLEFLQLRSFYSQRLFDLLWSHSDQIKGFEIPTDHLREYLRAPESAHNYYNFDKTILAQTHEEITTKTSLKYTYTPIRRGGQKSKTGKVYKIAFDIQSKKKRKNRNQNDTYLAEEAKKCVARIGQGICYHDHQNANVCQYCCRTGLNAHLQINSNEEIIKRVETIVKQQFADTTGAEICIEKQQQKQIEKIDYAKRSECVKIAVRCAEAKNNICDSKIIAGSPGLVEDNDVCIACQKTNKNVQFLWDTATVEQVEQTEMVTA